MRKIISGTAYDTDTGELIKEVGFHDGCEDQGLRLYRTRNGAFFLWEQYITPSYRAAHDIMPLADEEAQQWLEKYGNELVETYFGAMPEGGTAERRMTLRLPHNLAVRLEAIAEEKKLSLSRYIRGCLEKSAKEDGKVAPII